MNHSVWKSFAASEVTHSVAHYLTTIRHLKEVRGYARVSDVARELTVTKGSVSVQVKHLRERGYVTEDENRFLSLTPHGEGVARDVQQHREVLLRFIQDVLGVRPEQAESDACKIEHLLSQATADRLLSLVEILLSDDADARRFLDRFSGFKVCCPSAEECGVCEDHCLIEAPRKLP